MTTETKLRPCPEFEGALCVYHIPNLPREEFRWVVKTIEEAKRTLSILTSYDLYLGDLIESNAQGLLIYFNGKWEEWEDADCNNILEVMELEGGR